MNGIMAPILRILSLSFRWESDFSSFRVTTNKTKTKKKKTLTTRPSAKGDKNKHTNKKQLMRSLHAHQPDRQIKYTERKEGESSTLNHAIILPVSCTRDE